MRDIIKAISADKAGATAVEYGLILALIFLAMMGAVASVGISTGDMWDDVSDEITSS